IASHPLDIMCSVAQKVSGLPKERVIGLSGMLDASRLKYYIAEAVGVSPRSVEAIVLGEHGDSMVALPRLATIGGVQATNFLNKAQMADIAEKTAKGGAAVVALLGVSAWYGPGLAVATMVEAIIKDTHAIMPCSAYLTGQYGAKDMYMCCPIRLGAKGVEEIIEVALTDEEKKEVANSVASIKDKLKVLDTI
ncbi:MAG: malate dehydrogenase, partial [Deltaproteobacteria bacterium]|nr:malate dehydrogenase [Deltaproteobacteria bacterium]